MSQAAAAIRPAEEWMTTWDGTQLYYRAWLPEAGSAARAVVLLHRGHEHSGRFQGLVESLDLDDTAFFAWDARGHGRSPGERGYAESFSAVVKDLDCFVKHVTDVHQVPQQNVVVVANSIGAVLAATWVHDYAPPIRGLVLATPAFRVKLYVPLAIPGLRLLQMVRGKAFVKSYVKSSMLTHDAEQAAAYDADELISRNIAVNVLLDMYDTSQRILDDAGAIDIPTLMLSAGSDWVVKVSSQKRFFDRLSSTEKEFVSFPGFYHAVFHETGRDQVVAKTRDFIQRLYDEPPRRESLLDADRGGYTYDEYQRLRQPLSPFSPRAWWYGLMSLSLKTVGRMSRGVQLGWQTGFDSGRSLDHVYTNRPQGVTPLGKLFDRMYLDAVGWRGIRQRKVHLKKLLHRAIEIVQAEGRPVRVLDVASGPGRYVLETMHELSDARASAVLRDFDEQNVEAARKLAAEMNLDNVVCKQGDAFDEDSLAGIEPRVSIAIVSGLYELFPENERLRRSLRGIFRALEPGGLLIYTNQPWHPQLDMIARVLTSHRGGEPWIMRRRTQAEMDELVRDAGFEKLDMDIDRWGIFSVSLARRSNAA